MVVVCLLVCYQNPKIVERLYVAAERPYDTEQNKSLLNNLDIERQFGHKVPHAYFYHNCPSRCANFARIP